MLQMVVSRISLTSLFLLLALATGIVLPSCAATPGGDAERVLVFGGTGRTGVEIVRELAARGSQVSVFVRPTSNRGPIESCKVEFIVGDAMDYDDVAAAVASGKFTSIISAIGKRPGQEVRPDYVANDNIVKAAIAGNVRRVIQISSVGAGNSRQYLGDLPAFMLPVIEAKTKAENVLIESGLDYTIIRPGGLGNGPATGNAEVSEDVSIVALSINRADLGAVTVSTLFDDTTRGKILHVYDPTLSAPRQE
jgi:uncharacterized protein YbjT (DUF2867 family)